MSALYCQSFASYALEEVLGIRLVSVLTFVLCTSSFLTKVMFATKQGIILICIFLACNAEKNAYTE